MTPGGPWGGKDIFYGPDLAAIHDAGFAGHAERAAGTVLGLLAGTVPGGSLVVELGCGSGVSCELIARAGYEVLGFDLSPEMIDLARRRVPAASFECASFGDAELPRCHAVTAIGEVLNYTNDDSLGAGSVGALFARIGEAIGPGGLFVLDFATPGRCPGGERQANAVGPDWAVCAHSVERGYELTRTITAFCAEGGLYRRTDEVHRLRLFTVEEMERSLGAAGLTTERLGGYAGRAFPPGYAGLVARKPATR